MGKIRSFQCQPIHDALEPYLEQIGAVVIGKLVSRISENELVLYSVFKKEVYSFVKMCYVVL